MSCFKEYEYDPTGCDHCTELFANYKGGATIHLSAFKDRVVAMQRSIKNAVRSGSTKVPEPVKARFLAGVRNPFAPHARHLDPRPRSRTEAYSFLGEIPNPPPKPQEILNQAGTGELLLTPPHAPIVPSTFEGFTDQAVQQQAPETLQPSSSRGSTAALNTRGRSSSSSASPTPRQKAAKRDRDHDFAAMLHQADAANIHRIEQYQAKNNERMDYLAKSITQVSQMVATLSEKITLIQPQNPQQPQAPPQQQPMIAPPHHQLPPPQQPPHPQEETTHLHPHALLHLEEYPEGDQEIGEEEEDYYEEEPDQGEVEPYDPHHPEMEVPADLVGKFFYLPDEAEVYDDAVVFKGRVCNPDFFDWDTHRGKDIMTPIKWNSDIHFLIDEAPNFTSPMEQEETRGKYFACVRKIVDKYVHSRWGLESNPDQLSLSVSRPSRFLLSLKPDFPNKTLPFSLSSNPTSDSQAEALAFATAPKLGKEAHVLPGLLTTHTRELPDALRTKDFKARQMLHGLLFAHETSKFLGNIGKEAIRNGGGENSVMRSMVQISSNAVVPTLQALIAQAVNTAVKARKDLRERALASCKNPAIKVTLQGGNLFSPTLFDPVNVKQAEDCARNMPPIINVNVAKPQRPLPFTRGQSSNFRGSPRGRDTPRGPYHQGTQQGPRSYRGSARGAYHPTPLSYYYQEDGYSYEGRQQPQNPAPSTRRGGPRYQGKGTYRNQKNKTGGRKWLLSTSAFARLSPTLNLLVPDGPKDHHKGPHLEMVEETPSPLASTPLHLQGEPRTTHFQDVGRGRNRRAAPPTMLLRSPLPCSQVNGRRQGGDKPLCSQPTHHLSHFQDADGGQGEKLHSEL